MTVKLFDNLCYYQMKNSIKTNPVTIVLAILLFLTFPVRAIGQNTSSQEYYEIKIYHLTQKAQELRVDSFLEQAYLPALHRAGIEKVGVFKPVETDTAYGKRIYVFIPYKSLDQFSKLQDVINADQQYKVAGKSYLNTIYNNPAYARIETIILKAMAEYPEFLSPVYSTPKSERVYEMRSYESSSEMYGIKKIEMFNRGGEIAIFRKLSFNAVFFAQVIAGDRMPRLIYMPTFQNKTSQDEQWVNFRNDPDWKKLSSLEEFKNAVSKIQSFPLHPASYSDI
jgi:hypothetical protein